MKTKTSFKKTKNGFNYTGDLAECIKLAERKAARLKQDTAYVTRVYKEAERRFKAHMTAIDTAERFARVAREHLKEQEQAAADAQGGGEEKP